MGSDFAQLGFDFIRHMECVDEGRDAFGCHGGVGACESLESLVGLGIALATKYSLYGLGHYAPCVVEVGVDGIAVEQELAEALHGRSNGYESIGHGHTDVAEHGRVGKVALQT